MQIKSVFARSTTRKHKTSVPADELPEKTASDSLLDDETLLEDINLLLADPAFVDHADDLEIVEMHIKVPGQAIEVSERIQARRLDMSAAELEEHDERKSQAAAEAAFQRLMAIVEEETRLHGQPSAEELDIEMKQLTEKLVATVKQSEVSKDPDYEGGKA
jgi:hypothetical protein